MNSFFKLQNENTIQSIKDFYQQCSGCNQCRCLMMEELDINMKSFSEKVSDSSFHKAEAFSCVDCGECNSKCGIGLDVRNVFASMKEDVICQVENNKIFNTPYILQKRVNTNHSIIAPKSKIVFMSGCSLKRTFPHLIPKIFKQLKDFNPEIEMYDGCCTKPVKLLGKKELYEKYMKEYQEKFKNTTIITACFSCTKILKDYVNVVGIYDYMLDNNLIKTENLNLEYSVKLPCHIDEQNINFCKTVCDMKGIKSIDFDSTCCGSGGLIGLTNPKLSKKYKDKSISNLSSQEILCFCAECSRKLGKNTKHFLEFL
ncbi:MAG: heterodisulfide reductase-related iron-sulfur binding cluster [Bacilli bacterium]